MNAGKTNSDIAKQENALTEVILWHRRVMNSSRDPAQKARCAERIKKAESRLAELKMSTGGRNG